VKLRWKKLTVVAMSLVLLSFLAMNGCTNNTGTEWQRLVVEVDAINDGVPLVSGYMDAGPDRRPGTDDDFAPIDFVEVQFHARPYNQFITLPEDAPFSYFHITEYDLEWTPTTPGGEELPNYNYYNAPTDLLVPVSQEASVLVLVADRYMKEQPFFSDLFFNNKLPFNASCKMTFRGHQTGSDDMQEIVGAFMVTFVGLVVEQN
jgi:hypothetical protein